MNGRRHDHDAGGDAGVLAAKSAAREQAWATLTEAGVARFPGAEGRIPNFAGAAQAAERLRESDAWQRARVVKCNPDAPQWPVRQRALEDGKVLYMAAPRLSEERPFVVLDPAGLAESPRKASSIKGAARCGRPADLAELEPVDLVVVGCVAVGEDGARLGKGGGFADLELALAAELGLVGAHTVVATTVHDVQVHPPGAIPTVAHDVGVDLVATPTRALRTGGDGRARRPRLAWEELGEEKIRAIPVLRRLRQQ